MTADDDQWSPPDADFENSDWSPPPVDFNPASTTKEISDGPMGFINGAAGAVGKGILNVPYAAAHGAQDLYRRVTGGDTNAPDSSVVDALHVPLNENERNASDSIINSPIVSGAKNAVSTVAKEDFPLPDSETEFLKNYVAPVATDVASIAPLANTGRNAVSALSDLPKGPPAIRAPRSAQDIVAQNASGQSMGAASAGVDTSKLTPETQSEIIRADQQGLPINQTALQNHYIAETLPVPEGTPPLRLRKGQATGDEMQKSDEKNLRGDTDTQNILSDSVTNQDKTLVGSMGEIQRRANPDIVQRNNLEHDQAGIDAIKTQDNATVTDARAKYKALADANGGDIPIDAGTTINNINARLKKGSLRNTAQNNGVVSEVMGNLQSGEPMDFETFDNARSNLAAVQRRGGPEGMAAGIVHDELNNMPLSAEAAPLRDLADTAKSAWAARANTIKLNPAYAAAIDDNVPKVNGLHDVGKDSPLATGNFLDRFAIGNGPNASPAYVQRLKEAVPDPVLHSAIEAATLNKLRDAAGIDANGNGTFLNASYRKARNALDPKASVLLSPESAANTEQLKQASGLVNDEGKASTTNRSNTALTLQRFGAPAFMEPGVAGQLADVGADIAAAHAGPAAVVTKKLAQGVIKKSSDAKALQAAKDAKLKFAIDATKPGAGIAGDAPTSRIQRASGGKVSHEDLVEKLMQRWRAAKKATDKTTKQLLHVSDNTIAKALEIAGSAL